MRVQSLSLLQVERERSFADPSGHYDTKTTVRTATHSQSRRSRLECALIGDGALLLESKINFLCRVSKSRTSLVWGKCDFLLPRSAMSVQNHKTTLDDKEEDPRDAMSDNESEKDNLLHLPLSPESQVRSPGRRLAFLLALTFFSALGGFLFGYDTGVVSGAMLKIRQDFHLSPVYQELIVSMTIAGAAVAALVAGPLSDLLGRKPVLLAAAFVFTLGAVVMSAAPTPVVLLVGRLVVGLGVGLAAMAVPMFISEAAPAAMRGKLVVVNVAFVTGGQFIATLIDGAFSYLPLHIGWR